jgi:hypothetical protein
MFDDETFPACFLTQSATFDIPEPYSSLVCSQYIALSILCSDMLSTGATRQALVEPYQAPHEDNENTWFELVLRTESPIIPGATRG